MASIKLQNQNLQGKLMKKEKYQIGMIGLGLMGRNLVFNMADNGYSIVGYDKNKKMVKKLNQEGGNHLVEGVNDIKDFVHLLNAPRNVMLMLPAGPPVDAVVGELLDYLQPGDLIIDGGNSHFSDTELRQEALSKKGVLYLGVGISGGENGARHGPSIMPGGSLEAYQRIKPILESIAAKVEGKPCVTYLGPKGAGHYVKMVHNGIEYGLMELIAESYDLMNRGLGLVDNQLHDVFKWWNQLEPNSYLMEITANIFSEVNQKTGKHLIDVILDEAKQKGTGKWASIEAMNLQVPIPNIDIAVEMRNLSTLNDQRETASKTLSITTSKFDGNHDQFIDSLRMAFFAAMIITFSQGFALLRAASDSHGYNFDLAEIARIWRGGCIIRASLLNEIHAAFKHQPDLDNLLLDSDLGEDVVLLRKNLVTVVKNAAELGIPIPGFMVALGYLDGYRSSWLPANLIQAQRDYFGAHTYERIDKKGTFHHEWTPSG